MVLFGGFFGIVRGLCGAMRASLWYNCGVFKYTSGGRGWYKVGVFLVFTTPPMTTHDCTYDQP